MLKKVAFSPAQPQRAKTRRSAGKAAASEEPEAYPLGYVEDLNDVRTPLVDFFSILHQLRVGIVRSGKLRSSPPWRKRKPSASV